MLRISRSQGMGLGRRLSTSTRLPWVVSFGIQESEARSTFDSWATPHAKWNLLHGGGDRVVLRSIWPEFMPYFVFQGQTDR